MRRKILIVGASSTLGLAVAALLSEQNTELWLTYFHADKKSAVPPQLAQAAWSQVDATSTDALTALRSELEHSWGNLDGLVCAFGLGKLQPVQRTSEADVHSVLMLNVSAVFQTTRILFPLLCKGTDPAVVLFSSSMGLVGASGMSIYSASKAATANLARSLALEWAGRRIRVNAVAPGVVPSPMVNQMFSTLTPEQVDTIRSRHPLGFGTPQDVAEGVAFLLSPKSRWITGIVLPIDGGYTAH